jgi:hypothetical protein
MDWRASYAGTTRERTTIAGEDDPLRRGPRSSWRSSRVARTTAMRWTSAAMRQAGSPSLPGVVPASRFSGAAGGASSGATGADPRPGASGSGGEHRSPRRSCSPRAGPGERNPSVPDRRGAAASSRWAPERSAGAADPRPGLRPCLPLLLLLIRRLRRIPVELVSVVSAKGALQSDHEEEETGGSERQFYLRDAAFCGRRRFRLHHRAW